jgi:hypothetical protein
MARHRFNDRLKGHLPALRVKGRPGGGSRQGRFEQPQIPIPQSSEDLQGMAGGDSPIGGGPLVLIERLKARPVFSQNLAQPKSEDKLAVGQMTDNLGGAPFTRRRRNRNSIVADRGQRSGQRRRL